MVKKRFRLTARVSTDTPAVVRPVLEKLVARGTVKEGDSSNEFLVDAEMEGESAKELNRSLLSALRKAGKKTRLRAEWASGDTAERFFDYVPKGAHRISAQPRKK